MNDSYSLEKLVVVFVRRSKCKSNKYIFGSGFLVAICHIS